LSARRERYNDDDMEDDQESEGMSRRRESDKQVRMRRERQGE
jgi:hypothetical protein